MRLVRKGTFETNSSSCHSICWTNKSFDLTDFNNITLRAEGDDYGWSGPTLSDPYGKFSYWATACLYYIRDLVYDRKVEYYKSCFNEKGLNEIYNFYDFPLPEFISESVDLEFSNIKKRVSDYFNEKGVEIIWESKNFDSSYNDDEYEEYSSGNNTSWSFSISKKYANLQNHGSIDHQSAPGEDRDCEYLAKLYNNPEQLFNFVFDKNSYIIITNDNE